MVPVWEDTVSSSSATAFRVILSVTDEKGTQTSLILSLATPVPGLTNHAVDRSVGEGYEMSC